MVKVSFLSGQGTIEYLVIMAVVVVIGLLVVGLMSSFFDSAKGVNIGIGGLKNKTSGSIIVVETVSDLEGDALIILGGLPGENNLITRINVCGIDNNYSNGSLVGNVGFALNNITQKCPCVNSGESITDFATIYYTTPNGIGASTKLKITFECLNNVNNQTANLIQPAPTCDGVGTCTDPDDCYSGAGSVALKSAGETCLNGQVLRWSNADLPIGKGENKTYGHWYKYGLPNVHLVDNYSSSWVKEGSTTLGSIYINLEDVDGTDITGSRAGNGLYYLATAGDGIINFLSDEGAFSNLSKDANYCNYVNWNTPEALKNNTCGALGMRVPRIRETDALTIEEDYDSCYYSGGPSISGADGVISIDYSFTASAYARDSYSGNHWIWGSGGSSYAHYSDSFGLVCVAS